MSKPALRLVSGSALPNRDALRLEFKEAVIELDASRGSKLRTEFYAAVGDSVFDAAWLALEDYVSAGAAGERSRMHVVSAPVGSGKTSFSLAFIAAVARLTPFGCLVVVNQIERADAVFRDLNKMLPGKVAVWTSEHDPDCKIPDELRKVLKPAARFTKCELQNYPVAIVTHVFFQGSGRHYARQMRHRDRLQPRALTIIDERLEEVTIFDIALSAAQRLRETISGNAEHSDAVGLHMDALVSFMHARSFGGRDIERPADEREAWAAAEKLQWFASGEAFAFAKLNSGDPDVAPVFGFARALVNGYAFIARNGGDVKSTHYIGYEPNIALDPGTVLLDATADVDGVVQICPWRIHKEAPRGRYGKLHVVSIPPLTKMKLGIYLRTAKNRRTYQWWMVDTIKAHMKRGQRGLVVCKQALIENENVPTWPAGDPRFDDKAIFMEKYGWDVQGRKLCVVHWGSGIGSNIWKNADVVFLFDEFWIPRRTVIATAQGLLDYKTNQGPLAVMSGLNSRHPVVDTLWEGHLLRWLKQMALRGKGRDYDAQGVCGEQKLVCSADRIRLLSNFNRLFPGAEIEIISGRAGAKQTQADALLNILGRPGLPDILKTSWISQQMHTPWRDFGKHVVAREDLMRAIANLGWRYVSQKGCAGSRFERVANAPQTQKMKTNQHHNDNIGAGEMRQNPRYITLGVLLHLIPSEASNGNGLNGKAAA